MYHGIISGSIMESEEHIFSDDIKSIISDFELDIDSFIDWDSYGDDYADQIEYLAYNRSMSTIQAMVDLELRGATIYADIVRFHYPFGYSNEIQYFIEEIDPVEYWVKYPEIWDEYHQDESIENWRKS